MEKTEHAIGAKKSNKGSHFERWQKVLVICFLVYLTGFFLAPNGEVQQRWFYYTVTIIASFMLILKAKSIFSDPDSKTLTPVTIITILLAIPFLWTEDSNYLRTVRIGLEQWLFVFSFCLSIFYAWKEPKTITKTIPNIIMVCAGIALILYFHKILSIHKFENVSGALALSSNPNQTGMPFGAAAMLALSRTHLSTKKKTKALWLIFGLLLASATIFSSARSAMLGLAVGTSTLLYLKTRNRYLFVIPALGAILFSAFIFFHYEHPLHEILSGRSEIWLHMWEKFKNHPVFGIGGSRSYAVIIAPYLNGGHIKLEAHSLYFALAYYAGVYGVLIFGSLLFISLKRGQSASHESRYIFIPLLAYGLSVQIFEGLYPIYVPHPFWLFTWLPISILALSHEETNKTDQQETRP
ncbi:MAG: O-antigen ligase family protein [Alcanivorax sp.]|nr:O-antigen ligase family protein [Alcanivorax sp.]